MFTAGLVGDYQITAVAALVLPVPPNPFMILIERFFED